MASTTRSETTPLLHNDSVERDPGWAESYRFLFNTYLNILLLFVPLSFCAHHLNWDPALRFTFSFLAIVPLAKLLGDCTEQMSAKLGNTLAGLLNATFGNAVEIIVGVAALLQDEFQIVQTSMIGSILSSILLVLGCSFLAAGWYRQENNFQVTAAQASSSLIALACIALVIPAAYNATVGSGNLQGLEILSRGTAVILLIVYIFYIYFQLKSHAYLYEPAPSHSLNSPSAAELGQGGAQRRPLPQEEKEPPKMNLPSAAISLLVVTVVIASCADYLVASIEETADRYDIPKPFIGLILLPIVANAAAQITSIRMAMKNKPELIMGICVGSSIQIAVFVVPLLVVVGWITGHDLTLFFANFETAVLFFSVLLTNTLIQDGKSNYMEGIMLLALYLVIALAFWIS